MSSRSLPSSVRRFVVARNGRGRIMLLFATIAAPYTTLAACPPSKGSATTRCADDDKKPSSSREGTRLLVRKPFSFSLAVDLANKDIDDATWVHQNNHTNEKTTSDVVLDPQADNYRRALSWYSWFYLFQGEIQCPGCATNHHHRFLPINFFKSNYHHSLT